MAESSERPPGALTPEEVVSIPHLYTNGFQLGMSNADISLILKLDNSPIAIVHMSYTLAKTLHKMTGDTVTRLEKAVGRKMLVTKEVDAAFAGAAPKKRAPRKKNGKTE